MTILLAGGGTGGHVFPLVAVGHALRALRPELALVFLGTPRGMESKFVPAQGFPLELLDVLPIRGGGLGGALRGGTRALRLVPDSLALLRRLDVRAVLSIGGYAAGPVAFAAFLLGLPLGLIEPNSAIGLANRWTAPFVDRAYLAFAQAERHFAPGVVRRLGVPIRDGFEPRPLSCGTPPHVLVLGGSQGAASLNRSIPSALSKVGFAVRVTHQCGQAGREEVQALYDAQMGSFLEVEVCPFIEDMPAALARADLVISRSGASAVSEITAVGRPSLLIPYPHASGDHQRTNALALVQGGAAVLVEGEGLEIDALTQNLRRLLSSRGTLDEMAGAARALGRPFAASDIALDFLNLLEERV